MADPATTSAKSEIAFWAWVVILAALALGLLVYYLNKGVRDIISGIWNKLGVGQAVAGAGAAVTYVGQKAAQSVKIIDDATNSWALDYGYKSAVAQYSSHEQWNLTRSKLIQDFGLSFTDATNRMPTLTDFENGALPDMTGLTVPSKAV